MDKADEGDETRQLVVDLGLKPVVPLRDSLMFLVKFVF